MSKDRSGPRRSDATLSRTAVVRARVRRSGAYAAPPLILLVDDNEDTRCVYAEHLRSLGYRTQQAEDGAVALRKARATRPALVVLDYHMPVLDGFETARRLRADLRTRDIRLVLLTSEHGCDGRPTFDHHLEKPCPPERLAEVIELALASPRIVLASF